MNIVITLESDTAPVDQLRSLYRSLTRDDRLRGRVHLETPPPVSGTLGSLPESIIVVLGPGGLATVIGTVMSAVVAVAVAKIRNGHGRCKVTLTRSDGASVSIEADHVRNLDSTATRELITEAARALEAGHVREADAASPPAER